MCIRNPASVRDMTGQRWVWLELKKCPNGLTSKLIAGTTDFNAYWNSWNSLVRFALWWRRGSMGGAKRIFFCFVQEIQCEERTMEVYAVSKHFFWTFSAMLMHFQENYGRMICFFSLTIFWRKSISTLHVRMIWKYFSHVPLVVTQIRSEGPSFWSQAFLNFNSNALKVAKFRTPQLFGLSIDPRNILYFEWSPPSGMSSWHCILHTVWQVFWQFSFWHAIWLILWHVWHVFWLSIWHTFWHIWWLTLYLTRIMVVTIYMTYFPSPVHYR